MIENTNIISRETRTSFVLAIGKLLIYKVVNQEQTTAEKCSLIFELQKLSFGISKTKISAVFKIRMKPSDEVA